ncbi:MAG TPA: alpha-amylase family glycosyl hydrolase [Candidatus Hydrogenedentes bacterium]|nr:alpha-amylase family glycosyl hydrolase [Candidatus Hydrogenedentota bacterium]
MKRQTRFIRGQILAALLAAALSGCAALPKPATPAVAWRIDRGWPVAAGAAKVGEGWPVDVVLADSGSVFSGFTGTPDVTKRPDGSVEVLWQTPLGEVVDRFEPFPRLGASAWRRSLRYTNTSAAVQDTDTAQFGIRPRAEAEAVFWEQPWFHMVEAENGRTVCTAYWSNGDTYWLRRMGSDWTITVYARWRLAPGQTAEIGHQDLWIGDGGAATFRAEAQRWYGAHGFTEPIRYPEWIRSAILYEASAGGHIDSRFSNTGGFANFAHQIPYLADLGANALWLNAVQSHKTPPNPVDGGWNHYDPRDFAAVDSILGGAEGLDVLADAMRAHDIHFISEVVPHGGHSVQAGALEAWWTRDRTGEARQNWGGYGMDNAGPPWQQVLGDSMAMLAARYGIEGARIDVGDGQDANWTSPRTNHASFSTLGAGIEVIETLRDAITKGPVTVPVLIPECSHRPEYFAVSGAAVMGYGFPVVELLRKHLPHDLRDAAQMNRTLTEFFEDERGSLPPGALTIRTLNNHDTVCSDGRAQYRFGAGLARALYAVCLSVPGVPMMYQEEEVGQFFELQQLNWARRSLVELCDGDADYRAVNFAPEVFTVLRTDHRHSTICLVNLSGNRVETMATVSLRDGTVLNDAVSGAAAYVGEGCFWWTLEAYGAAFLRVGGLPDTTPPPLAFSGEPATVETVLSAFRIEPHADGLRVKMGGVVAELGMDGVSWQTNDTGVGTFTLRSCNGEIHVAREEDAYRIKCSVAEGAGQALRWRLFNVDAWYVSCRTALLHDRVLRRTLPYSASSDYVWRRNHCWGAMPWQFYNGVAPMGRVWQSIIEPLHPEYPAVAFLARAEAGLSLDSIETDAMNIVLTDCTDEECSEPYRLELRFHAIDPDLAPNVQHFGRNQPWQLEEAVGIAPRALTASFMVRRASPETEIDNVAAERLPVEPTGGVETREDSSAQDGPSGSIFLPEPGRLAWSQLAPVDGTFRIGFELRHSESGPEGVDLADAYEVEVDGIAQALEWTTLNTWTYGNAYFGYAFTPAIDLRHGEHTIAITTRHTWCAVRPPFRLRQP